MKLGLEKEYQTIKDKSMRHGLLSRTVNYGRLSKGSFMEKELRNGRITEYTQ